MALQIPQLRKALPAPIQAAHEFLRRAPGVVHSGVRAHVAALGEGFAARGAGERALARVAAEVRFEVAELGEGVRAGWVGACLGFLLEGVSFLVACFLGMGKGGRRTYIWFSPRVRPDMDLQMRLLKKRLPTLPNMAFITLLRILRTTTIPTQPATRPNRTTTALLALSTTTPAPLTPRTALASAVGVRAGVRGFSLYSPHQGVDIRARRYLLGLHLGLLIRFLLLLFSPRARRWGNGGGFSICRLLRG